MDSKREKLLKSENAELQKQLAAKNRDLEIEAALERVRARTMAMQHSEELAKTVSVLFKELLGLGIKPGQIRTCGIVTFNANEPVGEQWITETNGEIIPQSFMVPYNEAPAYKAIYEGWKNGEKFKVIHLEGEPLKQHLGYLAKYTKVPVRDVVTPQQAKEIYNHVLYFSQGCLFIITKEALPEYHDIFKRFGVVFQQSYTRFLDLKKSEAQAREAEVQLALERVRARTMAMQHSDELSETAYVLYQQFASLGNKPLQITIGTIDAEKHSIEFWGTDLEGHKTEKTATGSLDEPFLLSKLYAAWKNKKKSAMFALSGRELKGWVKYREQISGLTGPELQGTRYVYLGYFSNGAISVSTEEPLPEETVQILERFAAVFDGTYTRFLDLQRAEDQACEAQIETALERVRIKTMAMHNSADVGDTVTLMFNELIKLGVEKIARCGIAIPDNNGLIELWTAKLGEHEKQEMIIGHIDSTLHPMLGLLYNAWKSKHANFEYILEGDDLDSYITTLNNYPGYPIKYEKEAWGAKQYHNDFFFHEGMVFAFTFQPLSAEIAAIFKRFAGVFGQTYRRYLDLQKAEAAAREAQIEAALERVRSKAMAMRSSDDLNATANTVFIELRKLGVDLVRCGVGLMEKQSHISTIHAATNSAEGASLELLGKLNMDAHPVLTGIYKHWRHGDDYFPVLEGESLKDYYYKLNESGIPVPERKSSEIQYGYFFQFPDGCLYAWSGKQESEITIKTFKRFTSVIGLTYTRYIELQKAESNTKEAIKQASLDRVRAEIASMRKRSDLERITPLIWDELTILGIPFIRCGVFIMDEEQKLIHTFLSTPDGKAIGAFHIPFDTSGNFEIMVGNWRNKEPYIDHWKEEAFSQFADALVKQGAIASKAQYMRTLPHEGVHLNFLPFLQGMLYVGNVSPLAEDNISLIQAVADAFSTAYARYEDFNKLEAAKQQVDNTLADLKATQTRLIQSEKMASLGELTAGIAHEIQNPLNFVNNFSEVNVELIDEMQQEIDKGNYDEVKAIAADVQENQQKISQHGKRADFIVKGMLQHSRTSTGEKQSTDINILADEFFRLSYHGLRAKDKTFNSEMVTHFDPALPKINVAQQDIGRVLLNLFNNAFYAVNQKAKTAGADYKPEVSVSTSVENGQVIIKVKDNGIGIPDAIKEKIMQPFFTTKPTGEGTGLGLSLTYDMVVKGHGGSIQVNSVEGEGSEFIISLPSV
jgi:signal transduction histidine kinase